MNSCQKCKAWISIVGIVCGSCWAKGTDQIEHLNENYQIKAQVIASGATGLTGQGQTYFMSDGIGPQRAFHFEAAQAARENLVNEKKIIADISSFESLAEFVEMSS